MIRQVINVEDYWKIIVYYNINYNLFDYISRDLQYEVGSPVEKVDEIYYNLYNNAKAVTVSSISDKVSIVAFNKHKNKYDYVNSIVHEAEHVKQAMLKAYKVDDSGEPPAYTIGFIVMKMMETMMTLLCNHKNSKM